MHFSGAGTRTIVHSLLFLRESESPGERQDRFYEVMMERFIRPIERHVRRYQRRIHDVVRRGR